MNPGIYSESFELTFSENFMKKGNWLTTGMGCFWYPVWYIRILGFKYLFEILVLENPIQDEEYFKYKVSMKKKYLYWFNVKIYTFKTKLD